MRFHGDGARPRVGVVAGDTVVPLAADSLEELLYGGHAALEAAHGDAARSEAESLPLCDVSVAPPLAPDVVVAPGPRSTEEDAERLRAHREFYLKSAHTLVTGADFRYRDALGTLSYRAQLGLVLAPGQRHVYPGDALDHVLGAVLAAELYSVDLLRVGWEGTMWHVRYGEGASFDAACVVAPVFVTRDELRLDTLELEDAWGSSRVDEGGAAEFAAYVSRWMELGPSTLILAGSAHGPRLAVVGEDPVVVWPDDEPRLEPGDRVWARAEGLGEIDAVVAAEGLSERR